MQTVKLDEGLYRTDADNGVTVISERMSGVRSVSVGVWVRRASVHEDRPKMGVSHLLEHMVFKGTARRSARDIALELESRGGSLDAFTARDHTSFQARILDEDLPRALDVLTDLVRNPTLRDADLEMERKVVLEEISAGEDTPDDLVFELHNEALWGAHPYGFPILGTRETVGSLATSDLRSLHARAYNPRHVVIAAAGNLDHDVLLKLLTQCGWFTFEPGPEPATVSTAPRGQVKRLDIERDLQQTHMVVGTDTFPYADPRRYALMLLTSVLGGGMSSRLFQRVREELGLAYGVYAYHSLYERAGIMGVYVGTHPSTAQEALEAVSGELDRMAKAGLEQDDLREAKQQLKGQVTLSLESSAARMYRVAGVVLYDQPFKTIDEILVEIDAVTQDEGAAVAAEFFGPDRQTVVSLGPQ
jgi:predicted Zn-dependent peptidase